MPDSPLPYILENELADRLGIGRTMLAEARCMILAENDWARKKGGVAYFATGVQKACAHLHLEVPPGIFPEAPEPATAILTLIVLRPARHNPHILFAAEKKDGPEIAVRVRNASLFVAGQEIAVRMEGTLAHLHGPQPRQRGRQRPAR